VRRFTAKDQIPAGPQPSVVTIGNFDGVHRGHQAVLRRVVARARDMGARSVAVTFDPHPAQVHRPTVAFTPLTGLDERLDRIADLGLDEAVVVPYSLEFAQSSPRDFVRDWLVDGLGARAVVVGRDIRFGRGNGGDLETMAQLGREFGFEVEAVDDLGEADGGGRPRWSSTGVRALLADGDVEAAGSVLGRPHRVAGTVVHGDARGRQLGFPTANVGGPIIGLIPADGVYAGWLTRPDLALGAPDGLLPAAISIGLNPTFGGTGRRVEAHVPYRDDLELYGEPIALDFAVRLRRTLAFASQSALVGQMHDDVAATVRALRLPGRFDPARSAKGLVNE
jgi:riboflavin kinase/FMN adenylyltransferase